MAAKNKGSNMESRLHFLIEALLTTKDANVAETVIHNLMEILYGGLRALPTKGKLLKKTLEVHNRICEAEMQVAGTLKKFALSEKCKEHRGKALDLAMFIEQMNEVAVAAGEVTAKCGEGDSLAKPPCDELQPILDEMTGHEIPSGTTRQLVKRAFSVKLRGPRVGWWQNCIEEDVLMTKPIPPGHCVVVFKEFRGLMVRLHFERFTIVSDPWVATFGVPRGTRIPIWRIEWIFCEYVKQWNMCNVGKRKPRIRTNVTQRVKQDYPINWLWRYYGKQC
ncbi:MAG: hypothetical protein AAFZ15_28710 [Bacteroidota bacterium]